MTSGSNLIPTIAENDMPSLNNIEQIVDNQNWMGQNTILSPFMEKAYPYQQSFADVVISQ